MANVTTRSKAACKTGTIPVEGQILVNIEDMSMFKDIKKAISMVKGVGKNGVPVQTTLAGHRY